MSQLESRLLQSEAEDEQIGLMREEDNGNAAGTAQRVIYCEVAERLLNAFGLAIREVVKLHEAQFLTILDGDSDAGRFDLLSHEANERKQNAKYAYLEHIHAHGCSRTYETHASGT